MTNFINIPFVFPAKKRVRSRLFPGLLALGLLVFSSAPAKAHSVYIFAWTDGPQICSESYFSKNSKVRGGEVSMLDAQGDIVATGITDPQGLVCFPAPGEVQDLTFVVQASQGHRGEFTLPAAEMQAELSPHRQTLAESKSDTAPRARDIIGGMGWIAGIAALAGWLHNRRKKA